MRRHVRWYISPLPASAFAAVMSRFRQLGLSEVNPVSGAVRAFDDEGEPAVTDSPSLLGDLGEVLGPARAVTSRSFESWLGATHPLDVFCRAWRLDERLRCWTFALDGTDPREEALIVRTTLSVAVSMPVCTRALLVDCNRFDSEAGDQADGVLVADKAHTLSHAWDLAFVPARRSGSRPDFQLRFNNADLGARVSEEHPGLG